MQKKIFVFIALMALTAVPAAAEVQQTDFEVKTTQALVNLCTASSEDPLFAHAVNFCHGYLVGAFHFYAASTEGEEAA